MTRLLKRKRDITFRKKPIKVAKLNAEKTGYDSSSSEDEIDMGPNLYRVRRGVSGIFNLRPNEPKLVSVRRLLGIDYISNKREQRDDRHDLYDDSPVEPNSVESVAAPNRKLDPLQAIIHSLEARIQSTGFVAHPDTLVSRRNRKKVTTDVYDADDGFISDTEIDAQLADVSDDEEDEANTLSASNNNDNGNITDGAVADISQPRLVRWLRPRFGINPQPQTKGQKETTTTTDVEMSDEEGTEENSLDDEDESETCTKFRTAYDSELTDVDSYLSDSGSSDDCELRMKCAFHSDDEEAYAPVSRAFYSNEEGGKRKGKNGDSAQHTHANSNKQNSEAVWLTVWNRLEQLITNGLNSSANSSANSVTTKDSKDNLSKVVPVCQPASTSFCNNNNTNEDGLANNAASASNSNSNTLRTPNTPISPTVLKTAPLANSPVPVSFLKRLMSPSLVVSLDEARHWKGLLAKKNAWLSFFEGLRDDLDFYAGKQPIRRLDHLRKKLSSIWKLIAKEGGMESEDDEFDADGEDEEMDIEEGEDNGEGGKELQNQHSNSNKKLSSPRLLSASPLLSPLAVPPSLQEIDHITLAIQGRSEFLSLLVQGDSVVELAVLSILTSLCPSLCKQPLEVWWRVESASQAIVELDDKSNYLLHHIANNLTNNETEDGKVSSTNMRTYLVHLSTEDLQRKEERKKAQAAIKAAKAATVAVLNSNDPAVISENSNNTDTTATVNSIGKDILETQVKERPSTSVSNPSCDISNIPSPSIVIVETPSVPPSVIRFPKRSADVPSPLMPLHSSLSVLEIVYKKKKMLYALLKKSAPVRWKRLTSRNAAMSKLSCASHLVMNAIVDDFSVLVKDILRRSPETADEMFVVSPSALSEEMRIIKSYLMKKEKQDKQSQLGTLKLKLQTQQQALLQKPKQNTQTSDKNHSVPSSILTATTTQTSSSTGDNNVQIGPTRALKMRRKAFDQLATQGPIDLASTSKLTELIIEKALFKFPVVSTADVNWFLRADFGDKFCALTVYKINRDFDPLKQPNCEYDRKFDTYDFDDISSARDFFSRDPFLTTEEKVLKDDVCHAFEQSSSPSQSGAVPSMPPCLDDLPPNVIVVEHLRDALLRAILYTFPIPAGHQILTKINSAFFQVWNVRVPPLRVVLPPIPDGLDARSHHLGGDLWVVFHPKGDYADAIASGFNQQKKKRSLVTGICPQAVKLASKELKNTVNVTKSDETLTSVSSVTQQERTDQNMIVDLSDNESQTTTAPQTKLTDRMHIDATDEIHPPTTTPHHSPFSGAALNNDEHIIANQDVSLSLPAPPPSPSNPPSTEAPKPKSKGRPKAKAKTTTANPSNLPPMMMTSSSMGSIPVPASFMMNQPFLHPLLSVGSGVVSPSAFATGKWDTSTLRMIFPQALPHIAQQPFIHHQPQLQYSAGGQVQLPSAFIPPPPSSQPNLMSPSHLESTSPCLSGLTSTIVPEQQHRSQGGNNGSLQ